MSKEIKKEALINYIPVMVILQVACTGCGNTFAPKKPASVQNATDAHAAAMAYHNDSVLICPRREFIITYAQQLVDERIIKRQMNPIATNGN